LQRILTRDLNKFPYKIKLYNNCCLETCQLDQFVTEFLVLAEEADFHKKLMMGGGAHIHLSGFVNKHSAAYGHHNNHQESIEGHFHNARLTVWCGIMAHRALSPFSFKMIKDVLQPTCERYRQMRKTLFCSHCWKTETGRKYGSTNTERPLHCKRNNDIASKNAPIMSCHGLETLIGLRDLLIS
jgi:hypothetical protein